MKALLNVLPVGIFVLDPAFSVLEVNNCIEHYFGIPVEEMKGKDKRDLIRKKIARIWEDPEDFSSRVLESYDNNTYVQTFTTRILPGPNREERWVSHYSRPFHMADGPAGRIEIYTDITDAVIAEKHIDWLSSQIMLLQEKEKARIARDLHDELGQLIVAQKMNLENMAARLERQNLNPELESELRTVIRGLDHLSAEVQRISSDLMPSLLESRGLNEALLWLKDKTEELYSLHVDCQVLGVGKKRLPRPLELVIFRIFQEGLNNIVKHAKASRVELKLIYSYPKIIILIRDDGVGFSGDDLQSGLGLRFMRQRVLGIGGTMQAKSSPGHGTSLRLELPYYQGEKS